MQLLVIAPYPARTVPSQRFRFEQYLPACEDSGIRVEISSLLNASDLAFFHKPGHISAKTKVMTRGLGVRLRDLLRTRRYDLVYINRDSFFIGPAIFESVLSRLGVPYIFDFDDALYLANTSSANSKLSWLKSASKFQTVAKAASLVIAGNEHLAGWARQYTDAVEVFPTVIDTSHYRPRHRESEHLCFGWSGSVTTIVHLRLLDDVLREAQRRHSVRLRVIGDAGYRIDGADVYASAWRESTELVDLAEIDVGLMPLPDDEWSKGKCGLKGLQYMALGIPTVMSPVGVNETIARDGAALLAREPREWASHLDRLAEDASLRQNLGWRGRKRVEEDYSVDQHAERFVSRLWELRRRKGPTDCLR